VTKKKENFVSEMMRHYCWENLHEDPVRVDAKIKALQRARGYVLYENHPWTPRRTGTMVCVEQNSAAWMSARRGPFVIPQDLSEISRGVYRYATAEQSATTDVIWKIGASECANACGIAESGGLPADLWEKILFYEPRMTEEEKKEVNSNIYLRWYVCMRACFGVSYIKTIHQGSSCRSLWSQVVRKADRLQGGRGMPLDIFKH
jgi:hypothetical protein